MEPLARPRGGGSRERLLVGHWAVAGPPLVPGQCLEVTRRAARNVAARSARAAAPRACSRGALPSGRYGTWGGLSGLPDGTVVAPAAEEEAIADVAQPVAPERAVVVGPARSMDWIAACACQGRPAPVAWMHLDGDHRRSLSKRARRPAGRMYWAIRYRVSCRARRTEAQHHAAATSPPLHSGSAASSVSWPPPNRLSLAVSAATRCLCSVPAAFSFHFAEGPRPVT
jgi:hypothetical protein